MSNGGNGFDPNKQYSGSVKWFNTEKGFGFITKPEGITGDRDVFLHAKVLPEGITSITEGTSVTFQIARGDKGLKAVNVQFK